MVKKRAFRDWIGLVETAYLLDGPIDQWLGTLADRVNPALDVGSGMTATVVRGSPPEMSIESITVRGAPELEKAALMTLSAASPLGFSKMMTHGSATRTLSEVVYEVEPSYAKVIKQATQERFSDLLLVVCNTAADRTLFLCSPLTEARATTRRERQRLNKVAAHVGSGLRLRSKCDGRDLVDGDSTEAIFRSDGRLLDARGRATPKSARERLRHAVVESERARGPLRREDSDQALSLWKALVEGRWSLVDHFDSDGRRLVVAVENAPEVRDPRGLAAVQLQIAEMLGQGMCAKEIAYALGITVSAVNNAITEVKGKLGLHSRAEVATFFAPGGVRARLARLHLGDESLLVGAYGCCDSDVLSVLSPAERAVTFLLLQGATNRAIAQRRQSRYNTVANQIKAVYAKLGVTNRAELAARVAAPPTQVPPQVEHDLVLQ